jgi:hypothetical protein
MEAINGLLAGRPQTSERLAAMPLDKLKPSPFYNMLADGEPADKAITLLRFTQRSNGKQFSRGFRIVSERVQDATVSEDASNQYATVSLCTIEKVPDFTSAKDSVFIAVISKVVAASKPEQHKADMYIETMESVPKDDIVASVEMMRQLHRVSSMYRGDAATSSDVAWQQRKCRRLLRYPTQI